MILKSEDLHADHRPILREVCDFLGADSGFECLPRLAFQILGSEVIDLESKRWLQHAYEFELRQLERMLG